MTTYKNQKKIYLYSNYCRHSLLCTNLLYVRVCYMKCQCQSIWCNDLSTQTETKKKKKKKKKKPTDFVTRIHTSSALLQTQPPTFSSRHGLDSLRWDTTGVFCHVVLIVSCLYQRFWGFRWASGFEEKHPIIIIIIIIAAEAGKKKFTPRQTKDWWFLFKHLLLMIVVQHSVVKARLLGVTSLQAFFLDVKDVTY